MRIVVLLLLVAACGKDPGSKPVAPAPVISRAKAVGAIEIALIMSAFFRMDFIRSVLDGK